MNKGPAVLAAAALLLALSGAARAEAYAAGGRLRVLMIASEAQRVESSTAIDALRAQLSDLPVDLMVEWTRAYAGDLRTQAKVSEALAKRRDSHMGRSLGRRAGFPLRFRARRGKDSGAHGAVRDRTAGRSF